MKKNGLKKVEEEVVTETGLMVLEGNLPVGVTKEQVAEMIHRDLQRTIEGVVPRLPQIKIIHAGALTFKFPPDETGKETKVDDFEGIIIDQHPCNAWWEQLFADSGGGVPPDCSSLDGKKGTVFGDCFRCPKNQFGTAIDSKGQPSKGKACKNMKRLHIWMNGHELPFRLTLPPSSIKEADTFFSTLLDRKIPMTAVKVRFGLEKAESSQGIEYSQIRFAVIRQINIEKFLQIQKFLEEHLTQIRGQEIVAEEYEEQKEQPGEVIDADSPEAQEVFNNLKQRKAQTKEGDDDIPF